MTYNANLTALHKGLTPIYADQDRINFAPKLAQDIRLLLESGEYLYFNKVYTSADETLFPNLSNTVWVVSDIDGWWTLAEPSIPNIERGFGDGSFDIDGRLMARGLTLSGSVLIEAGDRATIATKSAAVRKMLLESFNLIRRNTWLIVEEDDYHRAARVRLSGAPSISTVNSRGRIDFSIGLIAPDPVKYEWVDILDSSSLPAGEDVYGNGFNLARVTTGSTSQEYREYQYAAGYSNYTRSPFGYEDGVDWRLSDSPSSDGQFVMSYANVFRGESSSSAANINTVSITNHGNSNVYCIFRIFGPFVGPGTIANYTTGQYMNFVAPTNEGDVLVANGTYLQIDTQDRKVNQGDSVNGLSSSSYRSSLEPLVDWIYLQPGENIIYFNDQGTGVQTSTPILQVYWRSGWIG